MNSGGAFSARLVVAVAVVCAIGFCAFAALSAFAPDLRGGRDGRAHALSQSAVGYSGIVALERAIGEPVSITRDEGSEASTLVITPDAPIDRNKLDERRNVRILMVLPKWQAAPDLAHPGWVRDAGQLRTEYLSEFLKPFDASATVARPEGLARFQLDFVKAGATVHRNGAVQTGPIKNMQSIVSSTLEPVVTTTDGRVILAREANGPGPMIYILSDPDFLNTQGIRDFRTARAGISILDLLHPRDEPLVFDVTINGFVRGRNLMKTALMPPFLGATLCLVAAALLLGWSACVRSAPMSHEQRSIPLGKRALAENTAALFRNANRERHMVRPYADVNGAHVAERFSASRRDEPLESFLDRVAEERGLDQKFSSLLKESGEVRSDDQVLSIAQKIHSWKEEMFRASV